LRSQAAIASASCAAGESPSVTFRARARDDARDARRGFWRRKARRQAVPDRDPARARRRSFRRARAPDARRTCVKAFSSALRALMPRKRIDDDFARGSALGTYVGRNGSCGHGSGSSKPGMSALRFERREIGSKSRQSRHRDESRRPGVSAQAVTQASAAAAIDRAATAASCVICGRLRAMKGSRPVQPDNAIRPPHSNRRTEPRAPDGSSPI